MIFVCCFLLRGVIVWCCVFLGLRFFAFVVVSLLVCLRIAVCRFVFCRVDFYSQCVTCVLGRGCRVVCCGGWWVQGMGFVSVM